jgi:hypothetical protein
MGGGGGKTPEPKKFTPPPLNDGPPANPIPNFFAQQMPGQQPRPDPFAALRQMPTAQPQNPFAQAGITPEVIAALLARIRGGN